MEMPPMPCAWLVLAALTLTQPAASPPAGSGIEPLNGRQVTIDQADRPHVESFIAVDPRDSRHLLATAMVVIDGTMHAFPYASFDGGSSWTRGRFDGDARITVRAADPVVYIAQSGSCFFSTLAEVDGVRKSVIARSVDGGRTWQTTAILPFADRQWLAFDSSRGPFGGRTYFTGTAAYSSRDGGRAVSPFLARSDDDGRSFPFRSVVDRGVPLEPFVTPGGTLVLTLQGGIDQETWKQYLRDDLDVRGVGLMTSTDGGDTFSAASYASRLRHAIAGSARRLLRSSAAGGNVRTAMDLSSGRYRNRVYFAATDYDPSLDRFVVRIWHTADFGKTWSTTVASDAPRGDVANPAIAVNRDGIVAVIWNDRRDDPDARCWQLYASISVDGGEHFRPARRLSRAQTCTNEPRNWETFGTAFNSEQSGEYLAHFQTGATIPTRFPMGGDTQGLVADASGVFHAAWINGETGVLQLWYSSFRVEPAIVTEIRRLMPAATGSAVAVDPPPSGMEDVTRDIRFRVTSTRLDFAARSYTVTLQIENQSARTLDGPFHAVMRRFLSPSDNGLGLKNLAAANADSGGPGVGAGWIFETPDGVLAPGDRTAPRTVRFTFDGGIPEFPEGDLSPGFRVYGRATR
jgi:hypothetical protein